MLIKELSEKYNEYIIDRRRYYHQYPELTLQEIETTKSIIKDLKEIGIEDIKTFKDFYGCVGILKGGKPGKTVLLRADINALPVLEKTGLPFASKIEGKMHACGHDNHIAMLLGAAKILFDMRDEIAGTVKFLFQPAEELAVGAKAVVEQGVMDDVDACYGIHIWSMVDSPKINMEIGERMASCDNFKITIKGFGSHGSAPHLGHDAIVAASGVIMGLQTIVSRINNPLNAAVITIGVVDAGQRFNIIADKAVLEGTVRTFNKKFRMEIEGLIRQISNDIAAGYQCTAETEYSYLTGAVINEDQHLVDIAQNAVKKLYGEDGLTELEKMTGSEDFAYLMEKAPGVYGFIGARNPAIPGSEKSNHHECFTVDEEALRRGAAVAAQFAFDFLTEK